MFLSNTTLDKITKAICPQIFFLANLAKKVAKHFFKLATRPVFCCLCLYTVQCASGASAADSTQSVLFILQNGQRISVVGAAVVNDAVVEKILGETRVQSDKIKGVVEEVCISPAVKAFDLHCLMFPNLKKVSLAKGSNLERIGDNAFRGCKKLESINLEDSSVVYINQSAFEGCVMLGTVTFPLTVQYIGQRAFVGCSTLESIVIPAAVREISDSTFDECTKLNSVTFAEGSMLRRIGMYAFQKTALKRADFPQQLVEIGAYAFNGCAALESIDSLVNVGRIGDNAFARCNALLSIVLIGVESIGNYVFAGCSSLRDVTICSNVTNFGRGIFEQSGVQRILFTHAFTESHSFVHVFGGTQPQNGCQIEFADDRHVFQYNDNRWDEVRHDGRDEGQEAPVAEGGVQQNDDDNRLDEVLHDDGDEGREAPVAEGGVDVVPQRYVTHWYTPSLRKTIIVAGVMATLCTTAAVYWKKEQLLRLIRTWLQAVKQFSAYWTLS
jgi:hypothetical protein